MATKKKSTKAKKFTVDRKFLLRLANDIYDPSTKSFLRLCDGTLQNGPDPTDEERPMHCGLGELYYAMTGKQPKESNVSEEDVVDLALELSPLNGAREKTRQEATEAVMALKLPDNIKEQMVETIEGAYDEDFEGDEESQFREILNSIPESNDDGCGDSCSFKQYRDRSKRVASKLREAAKLLPR